MLELEQRSYQCKQAQRPKILARTSRQASDKSAQERGGGEVPSFTDPFSTIFPQTFQKFAIFPHSSWFAQFPDSLPVDAQQPEVRGLASWPAQPTPYPPPPQVRRPTSARFLGSFQSISPTPSHFSQDHVPTFSHYSPHPCPSIHWQCRFSAISEPSSLHFPQNFEKFPSPPPHFPPRFLTSRSLDGGSGKFGALGPDSRAGRTVRH